MVATVSSQLQPIPQRRPKPIVGNASDLDAGAPVQSLMRLGRELGPIYRLKVLERSLVIVSSSDLVAELCDEQRFDKRVHGALQHIRDFTGDGLFTARTDEPNWGLAHRILMPAFGPAAMRHYFEPMLDIAEQMLTKWERQGPTVEHDVPDNMTRLTLDTIALCGFGTRLNSFYQTELHPFVDAMVRALAEAGLRSKRLPLRTRLMLLTQQQYLRDIAFMNALVDQVIAERRASPTSERDLLALMLEAKDPLSGEKLDDLNIRHQIVTFLIAGHETTSGLLSFTLHHLLKYPEALRRAREEVLRVLGPDARVRPRFEQVAQLTYIDQVLRETLRLWPTAPAFAVSPKEKTVIGGRYEVTPGDEILILTPLLHRDPTVWGPDVEAFNPDRFAPEKRAEIPTSAFRPFGNGQRSCIGQQFAMQEATLVIALLLQRFELTSPSDYQLKVKETLTLKPEGLHLRVQKRPQPEGPVATPAAQQGVSRPPPLS
ncbi:MAG: cytochrome P450, partial [Myxococcaceae bacterium]